MGRSPNMRRLPNIHLLILTAFSAGVVYMFSGFLEQNYIEEIAAVNSPFRPSDEQTLMARRLNLEHRMMATVKETWPECVAQHMTAIQCKEFIDEEILTLFTGNDKYIQTYIRGCRNMEDEWYHVVEIYMDDNDLTVGRLGDGWVYYDFEWQGSGVEATYEQQTAIPPITSEETLSGAETGSMVETIYADPPPSNTRDEDRVRITTTPAWNVGEENSITTTQGTAENNVISSEFATLAATGATTTPSDLFDFSEPPLVLLDEPVLVEGSSIDGILGGNETNPINGGVLLDPSSSNTAEGDARLAEELSRPYTITEAGLRRLGPFNCRNLTGFSCCLLIKHQVRDSDYNGRAIQCHLDFEGSTCKKHYSSQESAKKVLIHANENEMVSQDPYIQGSWPSCQAAGDPGNENGAPIGVGGNHYIDVDSGESTTAEPSGILWADGDITASNWHDTSNLPDLGSCPESWILEELRYGAGDQVSSDGIVAQCKPYPLSSHCDQVGYEPFDEVSVNWKVAWDAVGTCAGEPIAGSKAAGSEFGPPTSSPTISGTNAPSQYKQFSLYGQGIAQGDDGSGSLADYDYIFYPNSEGCESLCVALNEESGGKIVGYTRGASLFSELRNACMCYFGEKYLTSTLPGSGNCPITAETCFTSGQALGPITSLIIDLKYETYINNAYIQTTQSTIVSSGEGTSTQAATQVAGPPSGSTTQAAGPSTQAATTQVAVTPAVADTPEPTKRPTLKPTTSHPTYQPMAKTCSTAAPTSAPTKAAKTGHWIIGWWWQNNGFVHNWGNHWRGCTKQMQSKTQCNCQGGNACKHLTEDQKVECGACLGKQACMLGRASHYPADTCVGEMACKNAGECFGMFSCRGWQSCMLTKAAVGDGSCWNTYEDDGGPATCSANQGVCEEINGPGGDAFACKGSGSTIGTNSCRGYRSCADSDESTSVGNQSCIGKHACWKLNSVGCAGNPNLPSCKSGRVGSYACLGKESCKMANAIVGDYSCHGHKSCISVTEYAVIGAGSCIGRESCRNLNGRIGAQSCLTPEMKDDLAYNFETDTPQSVCEDNSGQISASSCWWSRSCQSNQGRICEESCRGYEACQNNSGSVGAGSCTGEGSCNNNSGNIGAGACTIAGGCAHNTEDIPDGCPSLAAKQAGQCDGTVTLACNDPTLPSTPLMPTSSPSCSKTKDVNFDICFALDMSGSVCSKYDPTTCDNSCTPFDQCHDFTVDVGTCCENFRSIQDFTIDMVTALDRFNGEKSYSIVQFASSGSLVQSSSGDKLSTIDSVNGLVYTGGFTNHDQAILRCREALSGTPADRNKYMLVITDGVSTRPSQNPVDSAIASANLAKGDGINIIPVFITTTSSGQEALDFMSTISSNGMVFSVTNFESLETLEQELVEEVSC